MMLSLILTSLSCLNCGSYLLFLEYQYQIWSKRGETGRLREMLCFLPSKLTCVELSNPITHTTSESRIFADSADFADDAIAHVNFTFMSELRFLFTVFRIPISDLEQAWRNGKTARNAVLSTFQTAMRPTFQPNHRYNV